MDGIHLQVYCNSLQVNAIYSQKVIVITDQAPSETKPSLLNVGQRDYNQRRRLFKGVRAN